MRRKCATPNIKHSTYLARFDSSISLRPSPCIVCPCRMLCVCVCAIDVAIFSSFSSCYRHEFTVRRCVFFPAIFNISTARFGGYEFFPLFCTRFYFDLPPKNWWNFLTVWLGEFWVRRNSIMLPLFIVGNTISFVIHFELLTIWSMQYGICEAKIYVSSMAF